MSARRIVFALSFLLLGWCTVCTHAEDWPRWLGPKGDGSSPETGLITKWSDKGPKLLWKVPGGEGYSTIAVVGKQAFTIVQRDGKELVVALNATNGKELWTTPIGDAYKNQYGNGPRSTPTVEGDRVYVQSVTGTLASLERDSGKIVWQKDILEEFGAKNITWGLSASPLVDGDLVYAIPGGKKAGVVAFNKMNGKLAWKSSSDKAAYATPVAVEVGGKKQIIFFNAAGLRGVDPKNGDTIWHTPWTTEYDCNICTPLVMGTRIFVTSGESVGCAVLELSAQGKPDIVWKSPGKDSAMINYWGNSVLHNGYLYGLNGEFHKRIDLRCVNAKTGEVVWKQEDFGLGALTLADGQLFIATKKGDLVLVNASPEGYQEGGRATLFGEKMRTSPTISNGKLYVRDLEHIYCFDIKAK